MNITFRTLVEPEVPPALTKNQRKNKKQPSPHRLALDGQVDAMRSRLSTLGWNQKLAPRKLTPLHLAVMGGSEKAVELLVGSEGIDLDAADSRGWTAMHFAAAIGNQVMMKVLQQAGASDTVENDLGGTPQDLEQILYPKLMSEEPEIPLINEDGSEKLISRKDFAQLTRAFFVHPFYSTLSETVTLWSKPRPELDLSHFGDGGKYRQKFRVSTRDLPIALKKSPETRGYTVVARRVIKAGEFLTLYGGKYLVPGSNAPVSDHVNDAPDGSYVDGEQMRNFGPVIDSSFPNAIMPQVRRVCGVSMASMVYATDEIQLGQRVCIDYGTHCFSSGILAESHSRNRVSSEIFAVRRRELRPDALREFYRAHPRVGEEAGALWEEIVKSGLTYKHPRIDHFQRLGYVANVPSVYIQLVLEGVIQYDALQKLKQFPCPLTYVNGSSIFFEEQMKELSENRERYPNLIQFFLVAFEKGYVQLGLNLLKYPKTYGLRGTDISASQLQQLSEDLDEIENRKSPEDLMQSFMAAIYP